MPRRAELSRTEPALGSGDVVYQRMRLRALGVESLMSSATMALLLLSGVTAV